MNVSHELFCQGCHSSLGTELALASGNCQAEWLVPLVFDEMPDVDVRIVDFIISYEITYAIYIYISLYL